jgi:uncharacterized protein YcnI
VQLPTDTPLASVRVKPVPGWTAQITKSPIDPPLEVHGDQITEAPAEVTWTADPGQGIAPGQYQTFPISAGPLPAADSLTFPAIQTYSDGSEAAWIEPTVDGQPEPDHPAPSISLTRSGQIATDASGSSTESTNVGSAATQSKTAEDSGISALELSALVVAVIALLAALGLGFTARRRNTVA